MTPTSNWAQLIVVWHRSHFGFSLNELVQIINLNWFICTTHISVPTNCPLEMRSRTRLGSFKRDQRRKFATCCLSGTSTWLCCSLDASPFLDDPCRHFSYLDATVSVAQFFRPCSFSLSIWFVTLFAWRTLTLLDGPYRYFNRPDTTISVIPTKKNKNLGLCQSNLLIWSPLFLSGLCRHFECPDAIVHYSILTCVCLTCRLDIWRLTQF